MRTQVSNQAQDGSDWRSVKSSSFGGQCFRTAEKFFGLSGNLPDANGRLLLAPTHFGNKPSRDLLRACGLMPKSKATFDHAFSFAWAANTSFAGLPDALASP
jgi:hypothetical protein